MKKNLKILLVEDDLDIQDNLKLFLEMEGYEVASAYNGREALEYLAKNPLPQLILLDLMMPIMSGYELLAELRKPELAAKYKIPIVLLSAAADIEDVASRQVAHFIRKPLSLKILVETIKDIAQKIK